jgi:hypothetical protein
MLQGLHKFIEKPVNCEPATVNGYRISCFYDGKPWPKRIRTPATHAANQVVDLHAFQNTPSKLSDLFTGALIDFKPARPSPDIDSQTAQRIKDLFFDIFSDMGREHAEVSSLSVSSFKFRVELTISEF